MIEETLFMTALRAILFGSYARDTTTSQSVVDIMLLLVHLLVNRRT